MTDLRADLAQVLKEHKYDLVKAVCSCSDFVQVGLRCDPETHEQHVAGVLLDAGYRKPRTITTLEELDALPMESVLKSAEGNVWESLVGGWFETCSRACHIASDIALPATVLYEPEAS